MSFIHSSIPRAAVKQNLRPVSRRLSPQPNPPRRCFATQKEIAQGSNSRWMLLSLGIGVPIAFYLWQTGAVKKQSPNPATQPRGAAQEYIQNAEGSENGERESKALAPYIDEPRGMGAPGPSGSISFKQEGLDNGDAMNPFVNEPGLSKKGEGETDTVKVKGTVQVGRRPA